MERIVVEYLANALWQIPLLAAGVGALLWALGSDVQTRHRVWLAVLALAVLMPLRGMDLPATSTAAAPALSAEVGSWRAAALPAEAVLAERRTPMLVFGEMSSRWIVRLYVGALLFAGWRISRAWFAAQALLRRSRSIHLAPRAMAIFSQAATRHNIPLPRLRQSDETVSPVVIGAWRPVLLLPAGFDSLKDDEILAALSHEFAHLARRDYLVILICQIAALPISWHPATHFVQRRIRDTREMLCDAVAADEMASPVRYATCLVAFAFRALDNHQGALATQGLSMFDNHSLEERILQLTQEPKRPEPRTRLVRLCGASLGLAVSVTLALLFHITPTFADSPDTAGPVELTPQVVLPVVPAAPEAPVAPTAPIASTHQHAHKAASDEIQRGIAEEKRQQADHQREAADRQREKAQEQAERDRERAQEAAEREREKVRDKAQHERDVAQAQRDAAQAQRDLARQVAEERREALREAADAQREAAQEAAQAAREAGEEARRHADEIKRQEAEAVKANEAARNIDMEAIRRQVSAVAANVNGPELKAQMAELQANLQKLHDNMSELREHMKAINKEMEKSLNAPTL